MSDITGQNVMDFSPATRISHPDTSRIAEKKITESGTRKFHCDIVLATLHQYNGSTTGELAPHTQEVEPNRLLTEEQVHKRMNDLVRRKEIKRCKERDCKVKGSLCTEWRII